MHLFLKDFQFVPTLSLFINCCKNLSAIGESGEAFLELLPLVLAVHVHLRLLVLLHHPDLLLANDTASHDRSSLFRRGQLALGIPDACSYICLLLRCSQVLL